MQRLSFQESEPKKGRREEREEEREGEKAGCRRVSKRARGGEGKRKKTKKTEDAAHKAPEQQVAITTAP